MVSTCPDSSALTITVMGMAAVFAFVAGTVGHGVLRPLMEARGVSPWRLKDSAGSLPLVLIGAALMGGAAAVFAAWGVTGCDAAGWAVVALCAAIICGVLMMRLGLLALRKLV